MPQDHQDPSNPYAAPPESGSTGEKRPKSGHCPYCGSDKHKVPTFTWWGGAVGQRLTNHTICQKCNKGFNKKTGQSNIINMVIYQVVLGVIAFAIGFYLFNN